MKPPSELAVPSDRADSLGRRITRGAVGTVVLNVAGSGLNLVIAIVLSHLLGLSGYGIVAFVIATLTLLTVPAVFGLDRLLTKEVAVHDRRDRIAAAVALVAGARTLTLLTSLAVGTAAAVLTWIMSGARVTPTAATMWLGLLSLPLAVWNRVQQGATLGFRRIVTAQAPEMVIRPLVFVVLVLLAAAVIGAPLAPELVIILFAASFAVAVVTGALFLGRAMPAGAERPFLGSLPSLRQAVPFALLGGASVVNNQAGIVLLGLLAVTDDAGLYGAAARLVLLIPFPLTAINAVLAPTAARLWDAGRVDELRRLVTWSARATFVVSLPAALAFILFGEWFLDLAFPPAFVAAAPALAILSLGQLVNASMGSVGTLLMMTGHQQVAATGVIAGAVITLILSLILIPLAGVVGAAVAAATSLTAWNVWLAIATRRRLGIDSTALGLHPAVSGPGSTDA